MLPLEVEKVLFNVKKDYPNAFLVTILDEVGEYEDVLLVVARPLSLWESNNIASVLARDTQAGQELVLNNSVLYVFSTSKDDELTLSDLPLGSALKIADDLIELAALNDASVINNEIQEFRVVSATLIYEGAKFIMKAFPQYKLKDIKNLTRTEFAELIMLSEGVHGNPFLIQDPNTMESEERQNQKQLQAIHKEARTNSKLFDFGDENQKLAEHM